MFAKRCVAKIGSVAVDFILREAVGQKDRRGMLKRHATLLRVGNGKKLLRHLPACRSPAVGQLALLVVHAPNRGGDLNAPLAAHAKRELVFLRKLGKPR